METRSVETGEVIFHQRGESREAYRILSGSVEISVNSGDTSSSVAQLREGEIFGEMGLIAEKPRSASATALEPTELMVISEENFSEIILESPDELPRYLATLIERLRTTDTLLEIALRANRTEAAESDDAEGSDEELSLSLETALRPESREEIEFETESPSEYRVLLVSAYEPAAWRGDEIALEITEFPFRIGCKFLGPASPFMMNDLLVRDTLPGLISRNHCAIERNADTFFIRDRGSAQGTIVNGRAIGTAAGVVTEPLGPGENVVVFGGNDSPHRFFVNVVKA